MARPQPLDPVAAYETIQRLLEIRDSIALSGHARQRMRERHFTVDDIRRVLVRGTVSPDPEWDDRFQNWKYHVSGRDYDNVPLSLVVVIEPAIGRLTVVTGKDD